MSEYIVSARKYRPDSFETLIGQDNIARTLKNSILRGQLAHAYLFCGPRGVGKTSTARIFAKTINCLHPTANMEPCGECESCVSFAEGRSYCIYELDAASNNSVEDIKTLMEKVQIPPQVGNYSVYIIDEVHMLSQAAFNAFLKTLEEPPSYAIFILCTTEKHKVLPTILSRCQTYDFNRIGISDMVRNLRSIADKEGVKVEDEALHIIAQKADGAMRDALTIFDQTVAFCGTDIKYADVVRNLGVLDYEYCFNLTESFLAGDYASALLEFDNILSKGFNALHFVSALGEHFRNLLVARTGGLDSLLDLPDSLKQKYREQGEKCGVKFIYDALGITTACEAGYKASTNQRLHIEYALMKLAFLVNAPAATVSAAGSPVAAAGDVPSKTAATLGTLRGRGPAPLGGVERSETVLEGTPQAAAPASVPAPEVAAEPKTPTTVKAEEPRKRSSRAKSVMSGLLSGEEDNAAESKKASQAADASGDQIPSDDAIREKWPELVKKCAAGKPRLQNALNGAQLTMEEADGFKDVSFEVTNEAQKKWIEDGLLRNMETAFATILGSGKVRLFVTVKPAEEIGHKVYMPAEKAQELMNDNPEVMNLVKDLGLDAN
ncbi:MAG: DNA polymerase III subunit gamma/tau [Bacteroidales bacterium]|nr:DNA polymerase III subunit gamma/tau [Bacteroidales bacterium]